MARLGALKGSDVRCLSGTFVVVVFFCCVLLLILQPSDYPGKAVMVNLPKDEVVRSQSIPSLHPLTPKTEAAHDSGKDSKKSAKQQAKLDKKAKKAKWLKDELPKKPSTKTNSSSLSGPGEQNTTRNQTDAVGEVKQDVTEKKPVETPSQPPPPVEQKAARKDTKSPAEDKTNVKAPFTNLTHKPLKGFESPFLDARSMVQKVEKKIVTVYHPPGDRQVANKRKNQVFEDCPESRCKLAFPLPPGARADAIIVYQVNKSFPPPRTHYDQAFVFHDMTSGGQIHPLPPAWNSIFNWTWTYRRDSDIWQPLGILKKADKVKPEDYFFQLANQKTKHVAFLPKTCADHTSSNRDEYIKELGRYVSVSEFGPCSNKSCAKDGSNCNTVLSKKFFYLLAFEDDMCRDHVTEVFYRAWQDGTHVVPVVRGGTDYGAYFPEGTFVDADWFDSAKELSHFLLELIDTRKLYAQILWRKAHWIRGAKHVEDIGFCHLCHKLHNLGQSRKRYSDIRRWLDRHGCKIPRPF